MNTSWLEPRELNEERARLWKEYKV